ncbi:MAG: hypothetical protein M1826_006970 [Phylliscum demangeonii]|nr:MAG: hypothetical protein M1826_006970 [Phylliscum demangeonii]
MSPSSQPAFLPQFCFSTTALKDFLRLSRSAIDDTITPNLNALVTPAQAGFDPSSSTTLARPVHRHIIAPGSCRTFRDSVLFPSWQSRSDILDYCADVATSPDPDDPEAVLRETESARDRDRIIDERLDPYSARFSPREARTQVLAGIVRSERSRRLLVFDGDEEGVTI